MTKDINMTTTKDINNQHTEMIVMQIATLIATITTNNHHTITAMTRVPTTRIHTVINIMNTKINNHHMKKILMQIATIIVTVTTDNHHIIRVMTRVPTTW